MATPPLAVYDVLQRDLGMGRETVNSLTWLARPCSKEGPPIEPVDLYQQVAPLLGNPLLDRTITAMDLDGNGCLNLCQTCYMDSGFPSLRPTYDSIERLFDDSAFLRMIHLHRQKTLQLGVAGDLLTHPQGVEILKMVLEKTRAVDDQSRDAEEGNRLRLDVTTSFRPQRANKFSELIRLARANPDRLTVIISLPGNVNNDIHQAFRRFVESEPEFFNQPFDFFWPDGYPKINSKLGNLYINDLKHFPNSGYFYSGRVVSDDFLRELGIKNIRKGDHCCDFAESGHCEVNLNAEGLWLSVFATAYESHTIRAFTKITPENISLLTHIPFHFDYQPPPNWFGRSDPQLSSPEFAVRFGYERWSEFVLSGLAPKPRPLSVIEEN